MAQLAKLQADVASNPEDLTLRERYAEAVEADDAPRADLIRSQIKRWHYYQKTRSCDSSYYVWIDHETNLLAAHGERWAAPVRHLGSEPLFNRGFVEGLQMQAEQFLSQGGDLYAIAPIRQLWLTDAKSYLGDVMRSPLLDRLVALGLSDNDLDDRDVAHLANSPHLKKLRWLDLSGNALTEAGVETLVASSTLANVDYINLARNPTDSPVETFGVDAISGQIVPDGIQLPDLGFNLEARYGERAWLHAPSRLPQYPPSLRDL